MEFKRERVNGDSSYYETVKVDMANEMILFDSIVIDTPEFIGSGVYVSNGYDTEAEKKIEVKFYIPEQNPNNEPENWDRLYELYPEPNTAEGWEKYMVE